MPYPLWPLYGFFALVAVIKAWPWISALTPGAGAFVGAFGGLLAILAGAFYNADLNRKRDDRVRRIERAVLAASLRAEIDTLVEMIILAKVFNIKEIVDDQKVKAQFEDIAQRPPIIYQSSAQRIGILNNAQLAGDIVEFYRSCQWIGLIIPRLEGPSGSDVEKEVLEDMDNIIDKGVTVLAELSKIKDGD